MQLRTSLSHPLRIDTFALGHGQGQIGMTLLPGKKQRHALTGHWERDLTLDLDAIQQWGADIVITLNELHELDLYQVPTLPDAVLSRQMNWMHLPIVDQCAPGLPFESRWSVAREFVHARLDQGGKVLLHCLGGLGRTGTLAARILVERGWEVEAAIEQVRTTRPNTIETRAQEVYLRQGEFPLWPVVSGPLEL